jgi:hypothetical protein
VFFHDVNAIILMLNCELTGTIAGEDSAHLEEQNGIWLCHGISSGYDASARQSRNLKKGPVPEAVNRDVSPSLHRAPFSPAAGMRLF